MEEGGGAAPAEEERAEGGGRKRKRGKGSSRGWRLREQGGRRVGEGAD